MSDVDEATLEDQGAIPPTEFHDKIERIREVADYDIGLPPDLGARLDQATQGLVNRARDASGRGSGVARWAMLSCRDLPEPGSPALREHSAMRFRCPLFR